MVDVEQVKGFLVAKLKQELKRRGASTVGKKSELCERLIQIINDEQSKTDMNCSTAKTTTEAAVHSTSLSIEKDSIDVEPIESSYLGNVVTNNTEESTDGNATAATEAPTSVQKDVIVTDLTERQESIDAEPTESRKADSNESVQSTNLAELQQVILPAGDTATIATDIAIDERNPIDLPQQSAETVNPEGPGYVRVDNFQRPLNVRALLQWLSETCCGAITEDRIWINSIKTHCYIDFATLSEAVASVGRISGKKFPPTNTNTLLASLTTVSAKAAPTSAEAALKPGDWQNFKIHTKQLSKNSCDNNTTGLKRKATAVEDMGIDNSESRTRIGVDLFKRSALNSLGRVGGVNGSDAPNSGGGSSDLKSFESRDLVNRGITPTASGTGFLTHKRRMELEREKQLQQHDMNGAEKRAEAIELQSSSMKVKVETDQYDNEVSLDDLFRKTATNPPLYWMPVSADIVQQRMAQASHT